MNRTCVGTRKEGGGVGGSLPITQLVGGCRGCNMSLYEAFRGDNGRKFFSESPQREIKLVLMMRMKMILVSPVEVESNY